VCARCNQALTARGLSGIEAQFARISIIGLNAVEIKKYGALPFGGLVVR
jgi:hypothetical protein